MWPFVLYKGCLAGGCYRLGLGGHNGTCMYVVCDRLKGLPNVCIREISWLGCSLEFGTCPYF